MPENVFKTNAPECPYCKTVMQRGHRKVNSPTVRFAGWLVFILGIVIAFGCVVALFLIAGSIEKMTPEAIAANSSEVFGLIIGVVFCFLPFFIGISLLATRPAIICKSCGHYSDTSK